MIRSKLPAANATANASIQPVRVYAQNQSLHPIALLKQSRRQQNGWFSTQLRNYTSTTSKAHGGLQYDRSKFPVSRTSKAISQRGAAPFASTLRPNLTGGALPRTAGGYSIGGAGKARHFSHTTGCQAQVIHNVNAGIRAFLIGGGKARYDGVDHLTGEKRFRSISAIEDKVYKRFERPSSSKNGTNLEFHISPTMTAFLPTYPESTMTSLQTPNLLSTLSSDFARSLQSLSLILKDLSRLTAFGDLPISLTHTPDGPVLIVRFPGCDADLVSKLCDEVGVSRGVIREDEGWNAVDGDKEVRMALLFPFAPTNGSSDMSSESDMEDYFDKPDTLERVVKQEQLDWRNMLSPSEHALRSVSKESEPSFEQATLRSPVLNTASPSGYESLDDPYDWPSSSPRSALHNRSVTASASQEYEGVEGIYKFLQVCEESRR